MKTISSGTVAAFFGLLVSSTSTVASAGAPAPLIPEGYVSAPGGWFHPSCLHEVPSGAFVDSDDNVWVGGQLAAHYPACAYAPVRVARGERGEREGAVTSSSEGPSSAYDGWVADMEQTAPSGSYFDAVFGNIVVPAAPSKPSGQTLYFFQGLQSNEADAPASGCGILQPVLQFGAGPNGGGNYWSFGSWWWSVNGGNNGFHTGVTEVSPGKTLNSAMSMTTLPGKSGYSWQISMKLSGTNAGEQVLYANDICSYNVAFPATFEVENGALTSCNQVPSSISFSDVELSVGTTSSPMGWNPVTYDGNFQFPIGTSGPSCGWQLVSSSSGTTLHM